MKLLIVSAILLMSVISWGQIKNKVQPNYKEYEVCASTQLHKGKKDHGKPYCTSWNKVREYKDGRKDTISWYGSGQSFIGDEYEKYQNLSERGKYIVDSLKEDGIAQLQESYLIYEPIYMKPGKKVEQLWAIEGERVIVYEYKFWNYKGSNGVELLKEFPIK